MERIEINNIITRYLDDTEYIFQNKYKDIKSTRYYYLSSKIRNMGRNCPQLKGRHPCTSGFGNRVKIWKHSGTVYYSCMSKKCTRLRPMPLGPI